MYKALKTCDDIIRRRGAAGFSNPEFKSSTESHVGILNHSSGIQGIHEDGKIYIYISYVYIQYQIYAAKIPLFLSHILPYSINFVGWNTIEIAWISLRSEGEI